MISAELLSDVLNIKCTKINKSHKNNNISYWVELNKCKTSINIHELAHKCTIWNYKQNFKLLSELSYGIKKGKARLSHT